MGIYCSRNLMVGLVHNSNIKILIIIYHINHPLLIKIFFTYLILFLLHVMNLLYINKIFLYYIVCLNLIYFFDKKLID